jgi:hypothetical protein
MKRASMLIFVLWAQQLPCAQGGRMKRSPGSGQVAKLFEDKTNAICGGGTVRDLLTRDPSVAKIRTMPWDLIMKTADEYMTKQKITIEQLLIDKKRIEALKLSYEKSLEVNDLSDENIETMIADALSEGGFINAENAVKVECISGPIPGTKLYIKPGAYKRTRNAFRTKASEFFEDGDVRADAEHVQDKCNELLPGDEDGEDSSNCDELCAAFADICSEYGSNVLKAGDGASRLAAELEALMEKIRYEQKEMLECDEAKQYLTTFRQELQELKSEISVENNNRIAAREQFQMCQMELTMLEDDLASRQPEMENSVQLSAEMGDDVETFTSTLQNIESSSAALQQELATTKKDIEDAKLALKKASAQFEAIETLKDIVSTLMLQMSVFADEAVESPLLSMGFDIDLDSEKYFTYDLLTGASSSDLQSVSDLDELCRIRAAPVFEPYSLTPLCTFGAVMYVKNQINGAVSARVDAVKDTLGKVMTAMDTHTVENKMRRSDINRRILKGEPNGLYAVEGVFGRTAFFEYLTHWKYDTGDILSLYNDLGETIAALNDKTSQLEHNKEIVTKKGQETLAQMVVAKEQLSAAVLKKTAQDEAHALMSAELERMSSNIDDYKDKLAALELALELATQKWLDAKTALSSAHKEGTNLMERYAGKKNVRDFAVGSTGKIHGDRRVH